ADVHAVASRPEDPRGLLVAGVLRARGADALVVVDLADDAAELAVREVAGAQPLGDAGVAAGRHRDGDPGGRLVELRGGERGTPAERDVELERGQAVPVAAVDRRLAGVQRGQVPALV